MGGPSERELREKMHRAKEQVNREIRDLRKRMLKIEEIKTDALKRTAELKKTAEDYIDAIEADVGGSEDLASESKERLLSEIPAVRKEVLEKISELRRRICETITPE